MTTPPKHPRAQPIDRRTFIAGTVAAGVLVACGDDGSDDGTSGLAPDTYILVQRFPPGTHVPGDVRLPFSLSADAAFVTDGPESLGAQVFDADGNEFGARFEAVRRVVAPADYYAWRTSIDTPGFYTLRVDGGPATGASFQVVDPGDIDIPGPGDRLPGFDTPTVEDPQGVDPVCTRDPACPFHTITLSDALALDRPVAYLVGTPAFCLTGTCTPALEAMIEVESEFRDQFAFVHAEVYSDPAGTVLAPAFTSLSLDFEPTLFIADAAGVIIERLDGLWDITELRERLTAAVA